MHRYPSKNIIIRIYDRDLPISEVSLEIGLLFIKQGALQSNYVKRLIALVKKHFPRGRTVQETVPGTRSNRCARQLSKRNCQKNVLLRK